MRIDKKAASVAVIAACAALNIFLALAPTRTGGPAEDDLAPAPGMVAVDETPPAPDPGPVRADASALELPEDAPDGAEVGAMRDAVEACHDLAPANLSKASLVRSGVERDAAGAADRHWWLYEAPRSDGGTVSFEVGYYASSRGFYAKAV